MCWTPNNCYTITRTKVQHTIFVNEGLIDCVVGAVVEQVYSGDAVTCNRDNTRHQYSQMLYFYPQNAFGGRAPPRSAGGGYSALPSPSWIKGGGEKGEVEGGKERGKEGRKACKGKDPPNVRNALTPLI